MSDEQHYQVEQLVQKFFALVPGDKLVWDGTIDFL